MHALSTTVIRDHIVFKCLKKNWNKAEDSQANMELLLKKKKLYDGAQLNWFSVDYAFVFGNAEFDQKFNRKTFFSRKKPYI